MTIGMRLTRAGAALLAKCLTGKELHFTRAALGEGFFDYETEQVWDLTAPRDEKMTLPLEAVEVIGDGTARIVAHSTNAEVYEGFAAREHAIFATDFDTGEEILYSYINVGEEYSFIPSNNSPIVKDIKFSYVTIIRDAENVTATLDLSFAYTSKTDFNNHVAAAHPHPNTPNHLEDVITTNKIWATDNDNHLHQISIENFKSLLTETENDAENSLENELAINDANLVLVEDFKTPSITDNFKIKVNSCAMGGNLISVESLENIKTGAIYTISDGYNAENVNISGVINNISGYHLKLKKPLDFQYNLNSVYLYRTTASGSEKKVLNWQGASFGGTEANIARFLEMSADVQDYAIKGTAFLDNGTFILA